MIRYLWIDTACIKQGDGTDFAREASKMSDYYNSATLVVSAVHAEDSRKGCFATRNPLLIRPFSIGFKGCRDRKFVAYSRPEGLRPDGTDTAPLRFRAWCF